jgi:hypothetical protein
MGAVAIVAPGSGEAGRSGRRHLTPEAKSDPRGQRYNREKRQGERTDLTSPENQGKSETAQRLADQYQVSRDTIAKDGAFAEAVDTLEEVKQVPNVSVTQLAQSFADLSVVTNAIRQSRPNTTHLRRHSPMSFAASEA